MLTLHYQINVDIKKMWTLGKSSKSINVDDGINVDSGFFEAKI